MREIDRYDSLFQWYGERYVVNWHLLKAQALAESRLDPNARSPVGAVGLTQFMRSTWKWVTGKKRGRRNPERSIAAQAKYMSYLFGRVGPDANVVLAAYNWGEGNVKKKGTSNLPTETQKYIDRINDFLQEV